MKCYIQKLLLLLLVLSASYSAVGQDKFTILSGKIIDAQSHQPVPFASIQLKGTGMGTASNAEGEFIFKIATGRSPDTLLISSIGYKPITKAVGPYGFSHSIMSLEPATVVLKEITVNAQSGLAILKAALAKIPENYDTSNVQLTAFYREDVALGDHQLTFNEAVLDIYKTFHYTKEMNDGIRIVKGRRKKIDHGLDAQLSSWISNFSNGARGSLGDDLVKYTQAKLTPFNSKNFRHYRYEYNESSLRESGRTVIVIDISPRTNSRKGFLRSKVFMDEASLAILRIDYEVSAAGVALLNRKAHNLAYLIMSKVVNATIDFTKLTGTISYQHYNGKWYLGAVQRHWEAQVDSKKRAMNDKLWQADMDLIITGIDTDDVKPFTADNIGDNRSSMSTLIGNDTDEAFWENHNILKPLRTDSLERSAFMADSLKDEQVVVPPEDKQVPNIANRQNGFTRADTLRGKLTPLRSCYDVTFYNLDVAVNIDERSVKGSTGIRFKTMEPFQVMQVDLYANMKINKILYRGQILPYTREFNAVFIQFPEVLKHGSESEILIYYEGVPKVPDRSIPMDGGVLWDKDEEGNMWVQVVCQGSGASLWWPNKDHLSDEPDSMKIGITVPAAYTEISNGRLMRKTLLHDGQMRYEWFVSYPINNYNVTFNIGKYAHYSDQYIAEDTLTIDYYVMPYNLERSKDLFQQVKPMLACFEKYFGKYPFKRDGFTLVESLHAMEHQSGVCLGKITAENSHDANPLLWHESAHEWWGNAISCQDLADMWIHEAFATYAEALAVECRYGEAEALQYINDHQASVKNREPVIGVYDVNHIFYDIGDMYEKGMLMLNTFRHVLDNDSIWFSLLRGIQQHFCYKTLTSDELVRYICDRTGTDYTYFFDQYLKHTALPRLEVVMKEQGSDLVVQYRWQADVAYFCMPVKVTTAVEHFNFIYPTPVWKTITLKNMTTVDFDVDEDRFFIVVSNQ